MHKNRIIIILAILIFFIPQSGFTPSTKTFFIEVLSAIVVILAILIERKGFFSIQWKKKNTMTSAARTYVEHNGTSATPTVAPESVATESQTIKQ